MAHLDVDHDDDDDDEGNGGGQNRRAEPAVRDKRAYFHVYGDGGRVFSEPGSGLDFLF